jgi:Domain of unknown function (DUF3850)
MIHKLKTWPEELLAVLDGRKTFEVRQTDRDFSVGDILCLQEWNPHTKEYTGRCINRRVTYILRGEFGLPTDLCIMALHPVLQQERMESNDDE